MSSARSNDRLRPEDGHLNRVVADAERLKSLDGISGSPLKVDAVRKKVETDGIDRKRVEHGEAGAALTASGVLIEQARVRAGLTRKEVCALMFIGEAQYSRWANGAPHDTASFARMLLLPPTFWFHMNQLLNERFGLRRLIAAQLLGAAADLAIAAER